MTIKKIMLAAAATLTVSFAMEAGAPPTVMILPDKTWCTQNNFVTVSERNGRKRYSENYDDAFVLSPDLKNVVTQLNGLMKDNGLPAKDYGTSSELDDEEEAELEMYEGEDGTEAEMTAYEQALNKLRPDILIKIGWDMNSVGFNYTLSYRLEAIDSYSGKSIAQVTAETPTVKKTIPVAAALKTAATEHMPLFISRLQEHFDDLQENGREITVLCQIGNNGSGINFNSDINGTELSEIVTQYLHNNTVNHVYSLRNSGRNRMSFEQVRIPFKDSSGRTMQAKEFVDGMKKHLRAYGLKSENGTKGLGSGRLLDISGQ